MFIFKSILYGSSDAIKIFAFTALGSLFQLYSIWDTVPQPCLTAFWPLDASILVYMYHDPNICNKCDAGSFLSALDCCFFPTVTMVIFITSSNVSYSFTQRSSNFSSLGIICNMSLVQVDSHLPPCIDLVIIPSFVSPVSSRTYLCSFLWLRVTAACQNLCMGE